MSTSVGAHVVVDRLRIVFADASGRETAAVADATFATPRGGALGIVGESGSGKSTIARALLGFTRPGARIAGGSVRVGEVDVLALRAVELRAFRGRRAAMVPQNPLSSLTPHMTVGAQLAELVRQHAGLTGAHAKARALELMHETDLPKPSELYDRYPHELSGGQRQRVVIASALVARPELIVLDEPTTALDKTVEARVLDLVQRVRATLGATLVYVSHDLNVIAAMCDRIIVMKDGAIVETGSTDEIFERPTTDYTRRLVRAIPRLSAIGRRRSGTMPAPILAVDNLSFHYPRKGVLFGRRRTVEPALTSVSFRIGRGETLGVVGESGSGKSTIAGVVSGVLANHDGAITLAATRVEGAARRRPRELRRRIQMVFQDPLSSLNPAQTVSEIISRPLQIYFGASVAEAHASAVALLAELDLGPELMTRRPKQLSGGQQQRIAIARALAAQPDVLLCDEVTSALDVTIQEQVLDLLQRLQADRGLAVIFISHDLAVVAAVANRILVLEQGQVRDYADRDTVLRAPASAYTKRLLDAFRRGELRQTAPREPSTAVASFA